MKKGNTLKDYLKFGCMFLLLWPFFLLSPRFYNKVIDLYFKVTKSPKRKALPMVIFICLAFWFIKKFSMAF